LDDKKHLRGIFLSSEIEKIKKRLDELEAHIKKHSSHEVHSDKNRIDDLEARLKTLEEKVKKKV
jgi:tetrahydromethanopterin S-methyltransferase subunit G